MEWCVNKEKAIEKFWVWLAWLLPRQLAYWATIRLIAHSTSGKYGSTYVNDLTPMDVLKRWEDA